MVHPRGVDSHGVSCVLDVIFGSFLMYLNAKRLAGAKELKGGMCDVFTVSFACPGNSSNMEVPCFVVCTSSIFLGTFLKHKVPEETMSQHSWQIEKVLRQSLCNLPSSCPSSQCCGGTGYQFLVETMGNTQVAVAGFLSVFVFGKIMQFDCNFQLSSGQNPDYLQCISD